VTMLTICQALAVNVGLPVPDVIATSPDRSWIEALRLANEAGEELARRVDWGVLRESETFTGTGARATFTMPSDFARLTQGVTGRVGRNIIRPLTQAEWGALTPTQGTPRYFFLRGNRIEFWPYAPSGVEISVIYVSRFWARRVMPPFVPPGEFTLNQTFFTADDDTARFSEELLTKGLIARWRRQKGMPFADQEAEYEAMLADLAQFDDRGRF
jgi:hypothetical protein